MLQVYSNPVDLLKKYEQYFIDDEIRYSLILAITRRNAGITLMISSEIDDRFVIGVLAGKNFIIASNTMEEDVYFDLVEYMDKVDYPGIIGMREHCEVYHSKYKEITGKELIVKMDQRIYYCPKVHELSQKIGLVRLANESDIEYLVDWAFNFSHDIGEPVTTEQAQNHIEYQIDTKTLYVLELNNQLVSMAARSRSLNTTESVGFVYTPVKLRKNGYARRIVEEVTSKVLNDNKIATLYTDLSNPTSNSIYMKIGYKPYCDSVMLNKF
ncbi:MAG: GNAT family N-acetyltransferase [Bacillota bacterium]